MPVEGTPLGRRDDAPRPALILWLLAMLALALPGWIWLGVTLFGRWSGP